MELYIIYIFLVFFYEIHPCCCILCMAMLCSLSFCRLYYCLNIPQCVYSWYCLYGHLSCFQFGFVINNTAIYTLDYNFDTSTCISFGYIPRSVCVYIIVFTSFLKMNWSSQVNEVTEHEVGFHNGRSWGTNV